MGQGEMVRPATLSLWHQPPAEQHTAIYLVKIQLEGEELGRGEFRGRVKLGMAGQAEIVTGQERLLTLLVKKICQTISLG